MRKGIPIYSSRKKTAMTAFKTAILKKMGIAPLANSPKAKSKAEWRTIGGKKKYFRSKWEANYARYLEYLKSQRAILDWEHEPQTFWFEEIKRGVRSYLPDFKVHCKDGGHYFVEVKGYMDAKSKTKISRFKKYYPNEKLVVITAEWFKANSKKLKIVCPGWD